MSRWGKTYKDKRNWKEYNEELVIRGTFFFDFDFVDQWDSELEKMNLGKRGSPFLYPYDLLCIHICCYYNNKMLSLPFSYLTEGIVSSNPSL